MDINTESVIFTETRPEIFIFLTIVGAEIIIRSYRVWKNRKALFGRNRIYPSATQSQDDKNQLMISLSKLVKSYDLGPTVIIFSILLVLFFLRHSLGPSRTIYYAGSVFMDFLLLGDHVLMLACVSLLYQLGILVEGGHARLQLSGDDVAPLFDVAFVPITWRIDN